eukprot:SAG11_NODE_289_length_11184_cov_20.648083_12_plen_52_part_00
MPVYVWAVFYASVDAYTFRLLLNTYMRKKHPKRIHLQASTEAHIGQNTPRY